MSVTTSDFPVLPKEIWEIILLSQPGVYFAMVQCSKEFAMPTEFMQHHFTKQTAFNDWTSDWYYAYYLPNGWIHDYGNKPAITLSDGAELRCKYGVAQDPPYVNSVEILTLHNVQKFIIMLNIMRMDAEDGLIDEAWYDERTQIEVEHHPLACKKLIETQESKCNIL
jgi:hypothetical protein